ncbi:ABC transporter ATP-binding protein [uncultured Oribacterium sp.]|uniref:ABC transporter ATP-binding protein n=1 Tax=uncultured Oribacterium sp. TaxID=462198 RepID=UPI0028045ABA|nr:ABC transporter ATP-binding protein [uncultured Oribacterium sp.]
MQNNTLAALEGISFRYDPKEDLVLEDFSLSINEGEIFCLLGESGCGKTTCLQLLGGFLFAEKGKILIQGEDYSAFPPEKRPVSTVFQSYALFPHMTVLENVCYGLKWKGFKKKEQLEQAEKYLDMMKLWSFRDRMVTELSGGQQQRVALARSLAVEPKLLLMDEPLSNLDAGLRKDIREELVDLQSKIGFSMLFVTHDQEEAMELGHRIGIMEKGKILQIGSGEELYLHPKNEYIRRFFGEYFVLFLEGKNHFLRPEDFGIQSAKSRIEPLSGRQEGRGELRKRGKILSEVFLASYRLYRINLFGQEVHIKLQANAPFRRGEEVEIFFYEKEEEQ